MLAGGASRGRAGAAQPGGPRAAASGGPAVVLHPRRRVRGASPPQGPQTAREFSASQSMVVLSHSRLHLHLPVAHFLCPSRLLGSAGVSVPFSRSPPPGRGSFVQDSAGASPKGAGLGRIWGPSSLPGFFHFRILENRESSPARASPSSFVLKAHFRHASCPPRHQF